MRNFQRKLPIPYKSEEQNKSNQLLKALKSQPWFKRFAYLLYLYPHTLQNKNKNKKKNRVLSGPKNISPFLLQTD